jgi:hypothetical protein
MVVVMVRGQFGRGVADVNEAAREVGVEILFELGERRCIKRPSRAVANSHGIGRRGAARRHGHPKTANLLLDKRDMIARAGKSAGETLRPGQRQNSEAVPKAARGIDCGESTVKAN